MQDVWSRLPPMCARRVYGSSPLQGHFFFFATMTHVACDSAWHGPGSLQGGCWRIGRRPPPRFSWPRFCSSNRTRLLEDTVDSDHLNSSVEIWCTWNQKYGLSISLRPPFLSHFMLTFTWETELRPSAFDGCYDTGITFRRNKYFLNHGSRKPLNNPMSLNAGCLEIGMTYTSPDRGGRGGKGEVLYN